MKQHLASLSAGLLCFMMALGCFSKKIEISPQTFSIVYTTNVGGEIEPCG